MTSEAFRIVTPWELYRHAVGVVRPAYGPCEERRLGRVHQQETAPLLPDADYHYLKFETVFAAKREGRETVIVRLEADGVWRVCNYHFL